MDDSASLDGRLIVGRYRLQTRLGTGGMGTVWSALDEVLGREVAVKEVRPSPGLTPEQREVIRQRTMREARAAARISHPSAVTVYDVVEDEGRPWIVMELLTPRTLADLLASHGPLAPADAARIGIDLVDALQAAHRAGVLHRDVKPANVMLAESGHAVLTDFGIATVEDDPALTSTGMMIGSVGYMSPERARGERPTRASDLWSLGATLFTAVEGDQPFRREGQLQTLHAVVTEPPPPATHAGPLAGVIAQLLAKDPAERPDVDQARALLLGVLQALPIPAAAKVASPGADAEAESKPKAEPVLVPTAIAEPVVEPEVEPVVEPKVEPESTALAEPEPEMEPESAALAEAEARLESAALAEVKSESESEAEPEAGSEPEPTALAEAEVEPEPEAEAELEAVPEAEPDLELEPDAAPEAKAGPETEPEPEGNAEAESDDTAAPEVEPLAGSAPVTDAEPEPEPDADAAVKPEPVAVAVAAEATPRPTPVPVVPPTPTPAPASTPPPPPAPVSIPSVVSSLPHEAAGTQRPPITLQVKLVAVVAVLVLVAAVAVSIVSLRTNQKDDRRNAAGERPPATSSPAAGKTAGGGSSDSKASTPATTKADTPSPSPSASPKPSKESASDAIPAGFESRKDPTGFSIAVPKGWTRSAGGTAVTFSDPKSSAHLLVDTTTQPKADALKDWKNQEPRASKRFPGYQKIRIERVDYRDYNAADWEFTWRSNGERIHVLNRNIRVSNKRAYALDWSFPDKDWTQGQSDFKTIAKTFKPAS